MIALVAVLISNGVNSSRTSCARVCERFEAHHFVVFVTEDVAFKPILMDLERAARRWSTKNLIFKFIRSLALCNSGGCLNEK